MNFFKIGHITKTIVITAVFLILFFGIYNFIFFDKITANTYFGTLNISGRDTGQVQKIVANSIENYKMNYVNVTVGSQTYEFSFEDLGITFDIDKSSNYLIDNARLTNILDFQKSSKSLLSRSTYVPKYSISADVFTSTLDSTFEDIELYATNSRIVIKDGVVKVENSNKGLIIDRTNLLRQLKIRLDNLSSNTITAQYIEDKPTIQTAQVMQAYNKIEIINQQKLTLTYEFDSWNFNGDQLLDLLSFELTGYNGDQLASVQNSSRFIRLTNVTTKNSLNPILNIGVNNESLSELIAEMSSIIDKPTVDASLEFDGIKVSSFTPAQDGRLLDQDEVKTILLNMFAIDNLEFKSSVVLNLPVIETKAKIANEEINSLGIKELIASGVSYFQGSIPNRAFNIVFGSEFINGTVVPPGDVFSFNKLVGPVSGEQGFKQAYVINKGRTVLDDGGGICQVSTTVFRAALNAGLPIVERTAHAYRVTYYEQRGFEPGYDATIWSPTVDLIFLNDTGHHILVQTKIDTSTFKLQVDIYGTSDGRTVKLTSPVIRNRRPAPEPLYQDDPTIPAGTTKQVDWAAQGLTSVFDRTVTRNGEVLIDESFTSNFRPWQAVYLVGTGG